MSDGFTAEHWKAAYLGAAQERDEAVAALRVVEGEKRLLVSALRAVKADRPTAHSDDVWALINDALAGGTP